jgi:uncharacterized protein YndB with AHSA1/START domain
LADIKHLLTIKASPEKVYQAIIEQEGLANWWTRETLAKPQVGSVSEFKFGNKYHNKMRITRLEPHKLVKWECLMGDKQWIGTRFCFDLEEKEGGTILRFTHGNWKEMTDFFASCNFHWGHYMRSLKNYCETGQGEPFE